MTPADILRECAFFFRGGGPSFGLHALEDTNRLDVGAGLGYSAGAAQIVGGRDAVITVYSADGACCCSSCGCRRPSLIACARASGSHSIRLRSWQFSALAARSASSRR